MTDTVIEAGDRFAPRVKGSKPSAIDDLRRTGRVALADRALLAERLGQVAAKLNPDKPAQVVRRWFDLAWSGDRWAKRKRYVILPGETPPDPHNDGAYVASGGDWAALVDQAAFSQHSGTDQASASNRMRAARDLVRGTSFLPTIAPIPLHGDNARSLVVAYAERVAATIDDGTQIRRLWAILSAAPFRISPKLPDEGHAAPEALRLVAAGAGEAAVGQFRMDMGYRYEFVADPKAEDQEWASPTVRLGLRAHRRRSRIFVVPPSVLVTDGEDETAPEDLVRSWLMAEGLITGKPFEDLPDVHFDTSKGYGWQSFQYDILQTVNLEARMKPEGMLGLWITAHVNDDEHYHPFTIGCDTAAVEASRIDWFSFVGMPIGFTSSYQLIEWPTHNSAFMKGADLPYGAVSGLVEQDERNFVDIEGWIDDPENAEVQDLLFGIAESVRFLPTVPVDRLTPSPCSEQTVASAFFRNLPVVAEDRIGQQLLEQASRYAQVGIAYHEAVVAYHRALIDEIAGE